MPNDFSFAELTRPEAVDLCKALASQGHEWHIHALHPGCRFNPRPKSYCFVVEDTGEGQTWCAFSTQPFTEECRELVQLLHGDAILNVAHRAQEAAEASIVHSAKEACVNHEAWHHHMMKPGCVLSPRPKNHVITLERSGRSDIEILEVEKAPDDVLREIELLYFEQHS